MYAYEQENIAITGEGTFDGQAGKKAWWDWKSSGGKDSATLRQMGEDGVATKDRRFGADHQLRPNFVQPYHCRNVLIEGVTFVNSPMWIFNPVLCQNVTVRGVTVSSHGPNNDGCDPESCRDVLIEKCTFDTGDDCIAIKSGRNADGRRIGVPSENIIIRDCQMKDGHGGVVLGSEMSGGIRNIFVEDCVMDSPNLERAIRLKSNSSPGRLSGKSVRPSMFEVAQVKEAVVRINLQYDKDRGNQHPTVRKYLFAKCDIRKEQTAVLFRRASRMRKSPMCLSKTARFKMPPIPAFLKTSTTCGSTTFAFFPARAWMISKRKVRIPICNQRCMPRLAQLSSSLCDQHARSPASFRRLLSLGHLCAVVLRDDDQLRRSRSPGRPGAGTAKSDRLDCDSIRRHQFSV